MADDPKPAPPPAPPAQLPLVEQWSSISQGDLGLKAMFWTDENKTALTSRPIVGWITYGSKRVVDVIPNNGFLPIIIADNWLPAFMGAVPYAACVAPKEASDEEILAKMAQWGPKPNPPPPALPGDLN
jgi:hypothetical protein